MPPELGLRPFEPFVRDVQLPVRQRGYPLEVRSVLGHTQQTFARGLQQAKGTH